MRYDETNNRLQMNTVVSSVTSNPFLIINRDTGNIGISAVPNEALTVVGNISASGDIFSNNSFVLTSAGTNNSTTVSPGQIFYSTSGDIVLDANSRYEVIFHAFYTKTNATTVQFAVSGITGFTNVAAFYSHSGNAAASLAIASLSGGGVTGISTALVTLPATIALTTGHSYYVSIRAIIETSTANRINLAAWNGAAGTIAPLRGSYWVKNRLR